MNELGEKIMKKFEEDPVRAGISIAAFIGTNMVVTSVASVCRPFRMGFLKRALYSYGAGALSYTLANASTEYIRTFYDDIKAYTESKKYNSNNEAVNSETEKEVVANDDEGTDQSETNL